MGAGLARSSVPSNAPGNRRRYMVTPVDRRILLRTGTCLVDSFYLINSQLHVIHSCQINDSPVENNCKISMQKTALTDTLKHTQAVSSSANGAQCLALLVHTSTNSLYNS